MAAGLEEVLKGIDKGYVIDTNVPLLNPFSFFILTGNPIPPDLITEDTSGAFRDLANQSTTDEKPNALYIPQIVLWELNNIKDDYDRSGELRAIARMAISSLYHIREKGARQGAALLIDQVQKKNPRRISVAIKPRAIA